MKIYFETKVEANLPEVKDGFNEELFLALKPWWMPAELIQFGMELNDKVVLKIPPNQTWISVITKIDQEEDLLFQFIDEGETLPFPLKSWRHIHRLESTEDGGTNIIDDINFSTGFMLLDCTIYPILWLSFSGRPRVYCKRFRKNS